MALRWGVCVLFVGIAACDVSTLGEWDPVRCSNGIDDDHDGLIDCDDPDCWAFACNKPTDDHPMDAGVDAARPVRDADVSVDEDSGSDASILPPPPPPPPPPADDDSGMMSMPDASTPPPNCSNGAVKCPTGTACVNDICKTTSIAGKYIVSITSAIVPQRNPAGGCYDFDKAACSLIGACNGACLPDPFISALLNGVTTVGMTDHLADTSTPTWTNGSFPVTLDANDSLEFAAWNWDPVLPALRMFTCVPDLDDIPTGKLHCSPRLEPGPDGPYGIDATIRKAP